MRWLKSIDCLNAWMAKLFSPVILLIMAFAVYEVFRRYALSSPTTWVWEVNAQLMCFMGALAGGYALLQKAHVSVDVISSRFSPRTKALVDVVTSPLFFIFAGALIWYGGKDAWRAYAVHQRMISQFASPMWPIKTVIVCGAVLIFLQGVAKLVRDIHTVLGKPQDAPPEA
jgi:TRAP-type mannitol/chloroaromatic compound transport system permease small subunit